MASYRIRDHVPFCSQTHALWEGQSNEPSTVLVMRRREMESVVSLFVDGGKFL